MERVNFLRRLVAWLTDVGIVIMLLNIMIILLDMRPETLQKTSGEGVLVLKTLALAAIFFVYSLLEVFKAQSPGKMIMNMVIRTQSGSPAGRNSLILRWALKNAGGLLALAAAAAPQGPVSYLSGLLFIAFVLGCFLALRPNRLALHDLIAQTGVYLR